MRLLEYHFTEYDKKECPHLKRKTAVLKNLCPVMLPRRAKIVFPYQSV